MHARTGVLQMSLDRIDDAVASSRLSSSPAIESSRAIRASRFSPIARAARSSESRWESEADLQASEELGSQARANMAEAGQASDEPVREAFEVLVDDMV